MALGHVLRTPAESMASRRTPTGLLSAAIFRTSGPDRIRSPCGIRGREPGSARRNVGFLLLSENDSVNAAACRFPLLLWHSFCADRHIRLAGRAAVCSGSNGNGEGAFGTCAYRPAYLARSPSSGLVCSVKSCAVPWTLPSACVVSPPALELRSRIKAPWP